MQPCKRCAVLHLYSYIWRAPRFLGSEKRHLVTSLLSSLRHHLGRRMFLNVTANPKNKCKRGNFPSFFKNDLLRLCSHSECGKDKIYCCQAVLFSVCVRKRLQKRNWQLEQWVKQGTAMAGRRFGVMPLDVWGLSSCFTVNTRSLCLSNRWKRKKDTHRDVLTLIEASFHPSRRNEKQRCLTTNPSNGINIPRCECVR